jgi:hypothetical protein
VILVLDSRVTPPLWRKGVARYVIYHVQHLRKRSDLHVGDRIHLSVDAPSRIAEAVLEHRDHICAETLAVALTVGDVPVGGAVEEATIERFPCVSASRGRQGELEARGIRRGRVQPPVRPRGTRRSPGCSRAGAPPQPHDRLAAPGLTRSATARPPGDYLGGCRRHGPGAALRSSAGFAGAIRFWGEVRKGGEAPIRAL